MNIRKIAEEAGVSTATVSRVINDFPYVKPETRKIVLSVLEKYNYSPHFFARALSQKKSKIIALYTPENFSLHSSYFLEMLEGIHAQLKNSSFSLLLPHPELPPLRLFQEKRIAGALLLAPPLNHPHIFPLKKEKNPFVLIHSRLKQENWVDIDNAQGTTIALEYLWKIGHRKIAFIQGFMGGSNARERFYAYKNFLKRHSLSYNKDWILKGEYNPEVAYHSAYKLFSSSSKLPTAIFSSNDSMAMGTIRALKELNFRVPEDVSVVGFDDIKDARCFSPSLTTLRQPFRELGKTAVKILLETLAGKSRQQVIFLPELIIRESSSPVKNE